MSVITEHPVIDELFDAWRGEIGEGVEAYRGHVYRVLNYCRALGIAEGEGFDRAAIAAFFHDVGLFTDATLDYLPPSVDKARAYLEAQGKSEWIDGVSLMIDMHHKLTPYRGDHEEAVEIFRRADLVDVSVGLVPFGIAPQRLSEIRTTFPNAGFHATLARFYGWWILRHPLQPAPILRW